MGESKQVKVDNWGIFFLQRLQTFFNKTYFCDLTLQFEDNVQLKVHRLVMNACTEYFQVLEQTCEVINDCLIMPPDLQADVVVPIVNFMYTGILEFQTSIIDRLYSTARLMNMTVLTKLLDAQKVPISPIPKPTNKRMIAPITWNLQGKKIAPKTMDPDLPEPLPGRKLPIWKRKSIPVVYRPDFATSLPDPLSIKYFKPPVDEAPKPTRFEWPDDDDNNFDTNSFDEISYTSKPIIIPQREKSPKPSTSSNNFEELKRSSVAVKRPASPLYSDSKKVNIQDVKEYIKEQKLRSDYIDYDDSEAADNDLQSYENNNDSDDNKDEVFDQNSEDGPNKSILKNDASTSHSKRVRFSLEGKENAAKVPQKSGQAATMKTTVDMSNHTKIITEVLKKYPHLVKKNKNIKLKILAKGANVTSSGLKPIGAPVKMVKPASTTKVSYMVMKPGADATKTSPTDTKKDGHWSCHKCSNPNPLHFETYYLYRKHLTDVHNEKTDSQMCNICGHTSRKQNMLMYHKLVKHNITPPPSYQFPKCKDCSYIALSSAMLLKHQVIHTNQNLVCAECNSSFSTKSALISHIQVTGHTDKNNCPTYDCTYCTKKFISDETLFQHIKNNHKIEAKRDNLLGPLEEEESTEVKKENIITAEEIDALEEQNSNEQQEVIPRLKEKPKEKIKILSDVKVTATIKNSKLQPVKIISEMPAEETQVVDIDTQQLEPSSEAESLSNVASGIAASLGLVNTIVVLDDNQFILQSQDGNQENIITNPQNIILPDVGNINNIQNLVGQQQVITTDANTIISQATLSKNNITSTDELVMVLTDHDYSDASNNAVITSENSNIVVLYSHPVQNQDGQFISQPGNLMINSDMGLVEVGNNFAVTNAVPMDEKQCEESIELIQQEINNHVDDVPLDGQQETEKTEEQVIEFVEDKSAEIQEQDTHENNEDIPREILPEPESDPEKMEIDPTEEIQTEDNSQQQITEDHPQHMTEHQQISEDHPQQMIEEHQQISEDHPQQISEEHQQISEDHQQISEDHQQISEDHPRQMTEEEHQQIPEHYPQQLIEEHQQMSENYPQQIAEDQQMTEDHHQMADDHQQMTEHQQIAEHLQQTEHEHQQQHLTEEYQHQQITEEYQHQQITEEHLHQQVTEEHLQQQHSELLPTTEDSNEINEPCQETETTEQASETVQPIPEEIQDTSAKTVEDNQYEEPMEIEESIEMIQQEIHRTELQETPPEETTEVVPQNVPENSEDNLEKVSNVENISEDVEPKQQTNEKAETQKSVEINKEPHEVTKENEDTTNEQTMNEDTINEDQQEEVEHMEVDSAKPSTNESEITEDTKTSFQDEKSSDEVVADSEESQNITELQFPEHNPQIQEENLVLPQQEQETIPVNKPQELEELPENTECLRESNPDENQDIQETNDTKTVEHQEACDQQTNEENSETTAEEELQDTETSQEEIQVEKETNTNEELLESKSVAKETSTENNKDVTNSKISNLLDDWDDGDTDSQQSDTPKPTADGRRVVNTLINDWEDDEET